MSGGDLVLDDSVVELLGLGVGIMPQPIPVT
jgi:hypothetical protein